MKNCLYKLLKFSFPIYSLYPAKPFFKAPLTLQSMIFSPVSAYDPKDYWYRMKQREKLSGVELSTICRQLKLESTDGKKHVTDCADTQGLLHIIQSIPSPKAEPFKRWLAQVGSDRIDEIENPELALHT